MAATSIVTAVVVGGLTGIWPLAAPSADPDQLVLELRVLTYGSFATSEADTARQTVHALLASAGIKAVWRTCGGGNPCDEASGRPFVRVHLLPTVSATDPSKSGDAIRSSTGVAIALIYVPRIRFITEEMRQGSVARSCPLATVTTGHVVGLTIVHEVAHLLGLPHRSAGLMKARLGIEDVVACRTSAAEAFRPPEIEQMRRTLRLLSRVW
jgi:hypothetical protein